MAVLRQRYPGLRPFDPDEKSFFFGREKETEEVCRLLDLDNLVTLHSASGLGKSSLINAGVLPALKHIRNWDVPHEVVSIRFSNYDPELARIRRQRLQEAHQGGEGDELEHTERDTLNWVKDPVERFLDACSMPGLEAEEELIPIPKKSFWLAVKMMQVRLGNKPLRFVFVLDQFEELFTYPEERVEEFARQLGELYHQVQPESVRKGIERKKIIEPGWVAPWSGQTDNPLGSSGVHQMVASADERLDVKLLISMRSDKLSFLDRLKPYLPELMMNSFELRSFNLNQATAAITEPALLPGGGFESPRFTYRKVMLEEILDFLQDKLSKRIDPAHLQIICRHIERKVIRRQANEKKKNGNAN